MRFDKKSFIIDMPHKAGSPPPCQPGLPALPSLSLASPVEKPCCLGSSRLRKTFQPCLSAHVIPAGGTCVAWDLWAESL